MKRTSRARLSATAAVGALSLALITGCSDEGSKDSGDSKGSGSGSSAKALSTADLDKLLLAAGDLKGYKMESGDDTLPKSKDEVETDKSECAPLVYTNGALAPGDTDASVSNTVTQEPPTDVPTDPAELTEGSLEDAMRVAVTFVGLSSYEGDGAEKAMKAVSDGVKDCSGGFSMTAEGETSRVTKVSEVKASGQGDESVAFDEEVDADGEGTATFRTEVVRKGNTVATFYTIDFAALSSGKAAEIPAAVIEAQVGKLK
ncbi:hypothetical protein ACIQNG_02565 [Streptomyces sp. NPDC091377]|uniref:hypothetical protein n=1 Tax=unclassified Streptomyces TaxID=2593676 RepID=UPI003824E401